MAIYVHCSLNDALHISADNNNKEPANKAYVGVSFIYVIVWVSGSALCSPL